ncbi:Acyl-CoA dehydrogenase-related isoform 1 [Hibiscus syriacus]|uniref:pectinesterase n=1 Tax=Hibiscus syriacus TaxID=106335 RepID=A0A6A2WTB2_HIBSY|nr:Acyl-CoA dehydrogenase-related isoform 1 [Hibiscus syriacus]
MANNALFVFVFLVAVVASALAVFFAMIVHEHDETGEKSTSNKAVQYVCPPTDFKETCEKSLASSNSSDPKVLITTGFQAMIMEIKKVLADSKTLQDALSVCKEVLDYAIDDLEASFNKLGVYDISKIGDILLRIQATVYNEKVDIPKGANNVMFIRDGPTKTIITNNISVVKNKITTFHTATVAGNAMNFIAKDIGIEKTTGYEGEQAVALRASGDLGVFYNCHFNGYQDTLYPQKEMQFFRDCVITSTIDIIFGDSRVVFQNCQMIVRKPGPRQNCMVIAQGKQFDKSRGGFVLHNCTISGDKDYIPVKNVNKAYLNRPWKPLATVIIIQSNIADIFTPEGYIPMHPGMGEATSYFVEFGNRGPGSKTDGRVKWAGIKQVDLNTAKTFTPGAFLQSNTRIPNTGVPCTPDRIPGL